MVCDCGVFPGHTHPLYFEVAESEKSGMYYFDCCPKLRLELGYVDAR